MPDPIPPTVNSPWTLKSPSTLTAPPTFKFFSIPAPPSIIKEPVSLFVDCVVPLITTSSPNLPVPPITRFDSLLISLATLIVPPIPTPPSTTIAPVSEVVDSVSEVIVRSPPTKSNLEPTILTSLLNETGPSN